jgi:hypothetical protein
MMTKSESVRVSRAGIVNTRKIVWLLLLSALPTTLAAQDASLERIRQAYPAEAVQIEGLLADAEEAGTPTAPLLDKALEGAAKGVPGNRVMAALSAYATRLQDSRQLLGVTRGASEVVAGADALRRGIPPQTVRTMAQQRWDDIAVPLVVMGDLLEAGVPVDNAYGVVNGALEHQHSTDEMLLIPGAVRGLMRQGQSPIDAAGTIGNMIGRGRFSEFTGRPGRATARPPKGPPVPPGSGPPDHSKRNKQKGKGGNSGGGVT